MFPIHEGLEIPNSRAFRYSDGFAFVAKLQLSTDDDFALISKTNVWSKYKRTRERTDTHVCLHGATSGRTWREGGRAVVRTDGHACVRACGRAGGRAGGRASGRRDRRT